MLIVLPWSVGCVLGWLAAKVTRKLIDGWTALDKCRSQSEYQCTIRGMLVSIMVCDENYSGTVSKFGYAEAARQNALPPFRFPVTEYLMEPTSSMIDGEPSLAVKAEIINAPIVAKASDTITIVAKTDGFLERDLLIRPFQAVTMPPLKATSPRSGIVRWDVNLDPIYLGSKIEYEFQARTNLLYLAKTVAGEITLGKPHDDEHMKD